MVKSPSVESPTSPSSNIPHLRMRFFSSSSSPLLSSPLSRTYSLLLTEVELKILRWENAKSGILAVVIFALLYYVAYQLGYVTNPFEYSWGLTPEAVKKEAERAATAASTSPLLPLRQ
jgi:hypothetical protein